MAFRLPDYADLLDISARGAWDPAAIDLEPDRARWPELPADVRERLLGLFAGFVVGEDAVAEHLIPYERAATDPGLRACLEAQQREEARHALATARIWSAFVEPSRRDLRNAEALAPSELVALFRERLPRVAGEVGTDLSSGVALYHGLLEGVVFLSGQTAVRQLAQEWALPGVDAMFARIERDERWHVTLGVRALLGASDGREVAARLPVEAPVIADSWGSLVDEGTRADIVALVTRRLTSSGLMASPSAASPASH